MSLENPIHLAFLLVLVLLVFGAKRLPEMGRSLGSGMRGFRDALTGDNGGAHQPTEPANPAPATVPAPAALQAPVANSIADASAPATAEPLTRA